MSEMLEEQGPPGPACFGPRIMKEPPVPHFQLSRGVKTYDGNTKREDWLTDYLAWCVEPEEGQEMLLEIHQGECGHHACSRALVAKVF